MSESSDTQANPSKLTLFQVVTGGIFITTGILHFVAEKFFVAIVPKGLPYPKLLVQVSGVAEAAGGVAVMIPATRRLAGKG